MENQTAVHMELDSDEALVLFEFLARELDNDNGVRLKTVTNNDGELWALNSLHCLLEQVLVEPLKSEYATLVSRAQASLVERRGSWPS